MKSLDEAATLYVLNDLEPSDIVEVAPDQLHAEAFKAGARYREELILGLFGDDWIWIGLLKDRLKEIDGG